MWNTLNTVELTPWGCVAAAAATSAKSLQSCPTLCDPTDSGPPGSPVPGTLHARTLEWVAISFSNAWKWKGKVKSLSRVWLLATHGLQPTRLLRPWDFPGKSTGVGCHCLLQWGCVGPDELSARKNSLKSVGLTWVWNTEEFTWSKSSRTCKHTLTHVQRGLGNSPIILDPASKTHNWGVPGFVFQEILLVSISKSLYLLSFKREWVA